MLLLLDGHGQWVLQIGRRAQYRHVLMISVKVRVCQDGFRRIPNGVAHLGGLWRVVDFANRL